MIRYQLYAVGQSTGHSAFESHPIAAINPTRFAHVCGVFLKLAIACKAAASRVDASSSHRAPFSAVAGRGSPITPLGAMSRVSHANVAGAFSGRTGSGLSMFAM